MPDYVLEVAYLRLRRAFNFSLSEDASPAA